MNYDVIGDIHGHADKLVALLKKLGYRHDMGAWRHSDRRAIFVGDFIDRGPGQLHTLRIVREMVDSGSALAVMGNHEFNAVAWHTRHEAFDGGFLRQRSEKNRRQHAAFLAEVEGDPKAHQALIDWFLTLPLWLDLPELRVVHACWHPGYMAELDPLLKPGRLLEPTLVVEGSRRGSMLYGAIEGLLKGLEVDLPEGNVFHDKDGHARHNVRVRWWDAMADTYRKAAIVDTAARERLPDSLIAESARIGYAATKPVFFGHYWFDGEPAPLAHNVACVDYSAGKDGPLVAYRWDGNPDLSAHSFVSTGASS